jgi:hypothetical protein
MKFSIICVTESGEHVVCHGYDTMKQVKSEIENRVRLCNRYRNTGTVSYRHYIVIGSHEGVDGLHIFNEEGAPVLERFMPEIIMRLGRQHEVGVGARDYHGTITGRISGEGINASNGPKGA